MTTLEETIKVVLDQDLESSVDGHRRQPCIACLLKTFDEQRAVALGLQHVGVEIVSLDALGVRQDDLPHANRADLRPEPAHDFRTGKGEEQIDARSGGRCRFEFATQLNHATGDGPHGAGSTRAVDDAHTDLVARRNLQHREQMSRAVVRQTDLPSIIDVRPLEQDEVHGGLEAWGLGLGAWGVRGNAEPPAFYA